MAETPQTRELRADPARQATQLFKGVDYQIWQTASAWIDLGENEILVVEGAEDFDTVTDSSAVVSQVKNITSPLTLRSECACDALRNFWAARQKNPAHLVHFRLITSGALASEAGEPFGRSKSGLELWNEEAVRGTLERSNELKAFLLSDASVSKRLAEPFPDGIPSLVEYLSKISVNSFFAEFIERIRWLKGEPNVDVAREMVLIKLHAYGEARHLLPRDSGRALASVFEHVAHVAIRQHRVLNREDFRVLFDDSTRMTVPVTVFNQMQATLALFEMPSSQPTELDFSVVDASSAPGLPIPCAGRAELVESLISYVRLNGFVAILGSTGKGKSTLAKLTARKLGGNWLWITFERRSSGQILDELARLARRAASQKNALFLIIDDFNPKGAGLQPSLRSLAVLIRLVLANNGRIILTSQVLLGEPFLRQADVPPETLQQVTSFSAAEIQELCLQAGCPADSQLAVWARIVSFQTGRHPQLVHARVKVAGRKGWAMPGVDDVFAIPQEISDERQLARQLLEELDDREVELLHRLSLASQRFRKDQAIAVGEISPALTRIGDKFDALVGPWIEPAGDNYFRLSHLLTRAAEENWTPERVKSMRVEYGRAIQRTQNRTLIEANEILFQAIMTGNAELAAPVLIALSSSPIKSRDAIAEWLDWLLAFEQIDLLFPDNVFVCQLFALLQFRIASVSKAESAPKFANQLFKYASKPIATEVDNLRLVGAATDIILPIQVLVPPDLLLECWFISRKLVLADKRIKNAAIAIEKRRSKLRRILPHQSFTDMLLGFILSRRGGIKYLRQFIAAIDALTSQQRDEVVLAMDVNRFRLFGFIDSVWTHELDKEKPDWSDAVAALHEANIAGVRWKCFELCAIAARGIAAVQDEYLQQRDEALKSLADTAAKAGNRLIIRYQRGMVHFLGKDYSRAYEVWQSTLKEWPTDNEEAAFYAYNAFSNCGSAAGFAHEWDDARNAFEKGEEFALKVNNKLEALKFGIDASYSQWRSGARGRAIGKFAKCLADMEQLGQTDSSTDFHTTWKVMEHIAVWFKCDAGAPNNLKVITPRPGICSEAKTKEKHELVKDAPRVSVLVSWFCLAEAELYAGIGRDMFSTLMSRKDVNTYPNLRPIFEFLRARRALADRAFKPIPVYAEASSIASSEIDIATVTEQTLFQKSKLPMPQALRVPSPKDFVEESLLCALLIASAEDISWGKLLTEWTEAAPRMVFPTIVTEAIEAVKLISEAGPMEIYNTYTGKMAQRFMHVVAGFQLAIHPDSSAALNYVGLCALVTDEGFGKNLMFSHDALAKLTGKIWLKRIASPFELSFPRLTVPSIKAACESNKKGLALAASILLAASNAVNVSKQTGILEQLRKLAGE